MQHLIASYLFLNKNCPAGSMGSLRIRDGNAETDFTGKLINAPAQLIELQPAKIDTDSLITYLSSKAGVDRPAAEAAYGLFFEQLANTTEQEGQAYWEGVGTFKKTGEEGIIFHQEVVPAVFTPSVAAERIVHPQTAHAMLVGDKETTTMVMTEYFNEVPATRNLWWVWAIVLTVTAILLLVVYYNDPHASRLFGNAAGYKLS